MKFISGILGVALILAGLSVLVAPVYYHHSYRVYIDFSNIKWPYSIVSISVGILCLYLTFSKKPDNALPWICSKCEKIAYIKSTNKNNVCKLCGSNLEKLKGFYERHPGRK